MESLTPRARVACTLAHKEPDRIPIDLGSTACWFTETAYKRICEHFELTNEGDLFRLGENSGVYDEQLLDRLGTDFRHVYLHPSTVEWENWYASDKTCFTDDWGITRKLINSDFGGANWEKTSFPLASASIGDLDVYPWPDPFDPSRVAGLTERAQRLWYETDYAISARAISHGLFELAWELRGMERFMIDLMVDKPFAHKLLGKILDVQIGLYTAFLDVVGPYVQIVQTADDYGSQTGPLMSPKLFTEMIVPYRTELNKIIHSKAPHAYIQHHTCGSVYKLLPQLTETGIDILNPVQPLARDMDPERLKQDFGNTLTFHGGIDLQQALSGSVDDVHNEVRLRIAQLGTGGGYILAPCSNFQPDNPIENILGMIDAACEFGVYSLQKHKL